MCLCVALGNVEGAGKYTRCANDVTVLPQTALLSGVLPNIKIIM